MWCGLFKLHPLGCGKNEKRQLSLAGLKYELYLNEWRH